MSMEYIRRAYDVPARRGGTIKFQGKIGTITGSTGSYLRVKLQKPEGKILKCICHPTWEIEYLEKERFEVMKRTKNRRFVKRTFEKVYVLGVPEKIKSIAFPAIGCGLGGLNWKDVKPLMENFAMTVPDIKVLIYAPEEK